MKGRSSCSRPTGGQASTCSGDASILGHPDGLARSWAALANPNAGEVLVSAAEGFEFTDLGGGHHVGGGSHGSLVTGDSEVPLLTVGVGAAPGSGQRMSIVDVAPLVLAHFGVDAARVRARPGGMTRYSRAEHDGPPRTSPSQGAAQRVGSALGTRSNWEQLGKFCVVGASGYLVNLAVYATLLKWAGVHYLPAAVGSFLVAVASNYTWNRLWTFRGQRGGVAYQGLRFLVVSTVALGANLARPLRARRGGTGRAPGPGGRDRASSRRSTSSGTSSGRSAGDEACGGCGRPRLRSRRPRRAPAAAAADADGPATTDDDEHEPARASPFAPETAGPRMTERAVVAAFLDVPKVAALARALSRRNPTTDATFDEATRRWTVKVWSGKAGQIALGKVEDGDGRVSEAWTGPQVAWGMARGRVGSFGGKVLNAWWMWIPLSVVFFVGLADWRRLLSWHTARPARAALVRPLALVLQPWRGLPECRRSPRHRSATCSSACAGSGFAGARPLPRSSGRSGCSRRSPSFSAGSASASTSRRLGESSTSATPA